MALVSFAIFLIPVQPSMAEMARDEKKSAAADNILASDDFDVILIGSPDEDLLITTAAAGLKHFRAVSDLSQAESGRRFKSLWLSRTAYEKYLNKDGIKDIERYLDRGFSVYFIGLDDPSILGKLLMDESFSETADGENKQKIAFVTKNRLGEYFFGAICSEPEAESSLDESLLASTWNRRNDRNAVRRKAESQLPAILDDKVEASSGDDFSIGNDWVCRFGWYQYVIHTTYGDYTEWKAAFYLTNPIDGADYYAMSIEGGMDPAYSTDSAYSINYMSDSDNYGQNNQLRSYKPTASPTSNTYTFSLGSNLGKDSYSANISASWTVTCNDLDFYDFSEPSYQKVNILFDYDHTSYYARQTTWQNTCFIYKAPAGSTYCLLDNYRYVTFTHYSGGGVYVNVNGSLHYSTKVFK